MELVTMGKVVVEAKIENLNDLFDVRSGRLDPAEVRSITVDDALVDTGATFLSIPKRLIEQLGLRRYKTRHAKTPAGIFEFGVYEAVRLTIQGHDCSVDVLELDNNCPVLIGQLAIEGLDFIVDTIRHKLIGNPDHNGEQMVDLY